ncbi:hypothetical protein [Botrimarina hoheduenensis]|uniref:Uncharacterized protein n=1 Tax=Botrimarina hoheduenensis TaxID=2528000 RepID=A0A5C5VPK5_9BACT|nr:hypothetical protein [Botrimarina hoheduenensis]TWT40040.1 hypothetical protein Pla111_34770 [Botrimarina hoheduenensis]
MRGILPIAVCVAAVFYCIPGQSQVLRGKNTGPNRAGGARIVQIEGDSNSRRSDLEGSIWEYKVMENSDQNRTTRTKMTGQIRIKQSALFAIGKVEYTDKEQPNGAEEAATDPRAAIRARLQEGSPAPQERPGQPRARLDGLRAGEGPLSGGQQAGAPERIGDLAKQKSNELQFRFDEDDSYPLSGRATIKPDTDNRGGLWIGSYDEFVDGKKKKRWRIEMRKVEE